MPPQLRSAPCSLTLQLHKHISKDSTFWGDVADSGPQNQAVEIHPAKITAPRQGPKQQFPKDLSATEMRLVHLDLKGAAPRVSYLEQVRVPGGRAVLGSDCLSSPCHPAAVPTPVPAGSQWDPH